MSLAPNNRKRNSRKRRGGKRGGGGGPSQSENRIRGSYLDLFFAQYPLFPYDRTASVMSEFYRMCDFFSWRRDNAEREEAREALNDAMAQQFNEIYGTDLNDLSCWQNLCQVLRISPVPDNLEECREAVGQAHVNLVDLVDIRNTRKPVHMFRTEVELSEYTIKNGKFFPKENAYAGGVLRYLLRNIMNPSATRGSHVQRRRRR